MEHLLKYDNNNIPPALIKYLLRYLMENDIYDAWIPLTKTCNPRVVDSKHIKKEKYLQLLPYMLVDKVKKYYAKKDAIIYRQLQYRIQGKTFLSSWGDLVSKLRKEKKWIFR